MQVSSSMTIMPPEPIMEPSCVSSSKSTGVSRCSAGMHPPEGPPVCTALNALPPLDAAADVVDDLAQGDAHRAPPPGRCCSILPTRLKTLVPLEPRGADARRTRRRRVDDARHVRPGLHVVQVRWAVPQAVLDGVDVLGARLAGAALQRGHQGGGLAADEGAAAAVDADVEARTRCRGCPRPAGRSSRASRDGLLQVLHRQRVLVAHVDVALVRRRWRRRR